MKKVQSNSMFNSDLTPMFNGCVMMNEAAMKDEAVMLALTKAAEDNLEFRGTWGDRSSVNEWINS